MPAFDYKSLKFGCRGMNLNRPIDQIPADEFAYLQNVRSYISGRVEGRSPIALVTNDFTPVGVDDYVHSICTINDMDPDGAPTPASARFFGYLTRLWCSASGSGAHVATQNTGWGTSGSGNPQSIVVASPVGSPVPWMYVYDLGRQAKFSMRHLFAAMDPFAFQIGLPLLWDVGAGNMKWFVPGTCTLAGGPLTGTYYYRYQVRDPYTGVICQPQPSSGYPASILGAASIFGHVTLTADQPIFTAPSLTHAAGGSYLLDVFRYGGAVNDWHHVKTVPADGTDWTDSETDAVALNAPLLDDTRFQPWISEDIPRTVTCTIIAAVAGTGVADGQGSRLTRTGGDQWNTNWMPGTRVVVNDDIACTLHRFESATILEVIEDLGALGAGQTARVTGALEFGKPMPRVWGPYGSGHSGVTYFACGDLQRPGTLVWTTGNDPDSTNQTFSLEITDASDPLQNGCVYNGRPYVWSTRAMYEIIPDTSVPGQFLAQIIPGSKGLWAAWGLAVGDEIYFIGKDGIYSTTGSGAPRSITDDQLYPLFEHDNVPGRTIEVHNPETPATTIKLYPPDPALMHTWRLTYGDSTLYFDYMEDTSVTPKTLVYAKFPQADGSVAWGWLCDIYNVNPGYVNRYFEVVPSATQAGGSMLLAVGNSVFEWASGVTGDAGSPIACRVQTGALDLGDNRAMKLMGDQMIDANCNGLAVMARILGTNNAVELAGAALSAAAPRTQNILDVAAGLGTLSRTVGLWLYWQQTTGAVPEFYQWSPSYVVKPPMTYALATDWTNDGKACAKYLMGAVIEADISVESHVDLAIDGAIPTKVTSATVHGGGGFVAGDVGAVVEVTGGAGFTIGLYYILVVAAGAATLDRAPGGVGIGGGIYSLGGTRAVRIEYDGGLSATFPTLTLSHPGQTEFPYALPIPVVCHEMRLVPVTTTGLRLISVTWLWQEYPEWSALTPDYDLQKWPTNKYIRGVALEGDTLGAPVVISIQGDGAAYFTPTITQTGRTLTPIAFTTPFLASEVRVVPFSRWIRHSVRWIYDEYPDYAALHTPWIDFGGKEDKLLRGALVKLDTANLPVTLTLHADGAATAYTWTLTANGQVQVPIALNPPIPVTMVRLVPNAAWRFFEAEWIFDEYPSLAPIFTPWYISTKPRYFRAVNLRGDTANLVITADVQKQGGVLAQVLAGLQLNGQGVQTFPLTPFVAYAVRLKPNGSWRFFEADWAADEYPDLDARISPIVTLKPIGAKLIQGVRLTSDTGGLAVAFNVLYDGGLLGVTIPATVFTGKSTLPFSFAAPFIAHNLQIQPLGDARVFLDETEWIWEPAPELTEYWLTPMMTHGIDGWWSHVDLILAHSSTAAVTLTIITEDGATYPVVFLSSAGVYTRDYVRLLPLKCKAARYVVSSTAKFRLYVQDCRMTLAVWERSGQSALRPVRPFGDLSVVDGARI